LLFLLQKPGDGEYHLLARLFADYCFVGVAKHLLNVVFAFEGCGAVCVVSGLLAVGWSVDLYHEPSLRMVEVRSKLAMLAWTKFVLPYESQPL
jgi:hypothetical protein